MQTEWKVGGREQHLMTYIYIYYSSLIPTGEGNIYENVYIILLDTHG